MTALEPVPRRAYAVLVVCSATVVFIILDAGFIALAFPGIEERFEATSPTTLGWAFSSYFIAMTSLMLLMGWLGDRLGRRRVFFGGLGLFGAGALATACSVSPWMLISSRVLQGAGAAALTPVSLAMVLPAFPTSRRSWAVGAWGVAGALAGIVAPTVGAFLIEQSDWRAPFFAFVPIVVLVWLVGRNVLPDEPGSNPDGPIDMGGIAAAALAVGATAVAVTQGRVWGWTSAPTLVTALVALVAGLILIHRARTQPGAPLDLALYRVRSYAAANVVSFAASRVLLVLLLGPALPDRCLGVVTA